MTPGPTLVYQCSGSGKPLFVESINSGNTFGATFWTFGHMDAPMLPEELPFLISPHTGQWLWIDDLKLLKAVDWFLEEIQAEIQYSEGKEVGDPSSLNQVLDYLGTLHQNRESSPLPQVIARPNARSIHHGSTIIPDSPQGWV
jgi:hypothetical protein